MSDSEEQDDVAEAGAHVEDACGPLGLIPIASSEQVDDFRMDSDKSVPVAAQQTNKVFLGSALPP